MTIAGKQKARPGQKRLSNSSIASTDSVKSATSSSAGGREHQIKVLCRVRPFLAHENEDATVRVDGTAVEISNIRSRDEVYRFNFDGCYDARVSQGRLFKQHIEPLVENVFKGMSTTVFCYGVTGAGKTHTIQGSEKQPGIIPRTLRLILDAKQRDPNMAVRISYMEIYREIVYDLLIPRDANPASGLAIREDAQRNIFVAQLSESDGQSLWQHTVDDYAEFERLYRQACKGRSTASTKLNGNSSRSHAILVVYVDIKDKTSGRKLCGRVHLIDLAGSEDNRRTENGRDRMAESGAINRSLFVLGQVVEALNNGSTRIPFRDSKMTRILQDSLGGKSLGLMIVNVAPGHEFYQDTINTLNFAKKSKTIVNKAAITEVDERPPAVRAGARGHLGKPVRTVANGSAEKGKNKRAHDGGGQEMKQEPRRPTPSFSELRAREKQRNPHMSKEELEECVSRMLEQKLKEMQQGGSIFEPAVQEEAEEPKRKRVRKRKSSLGKEQSMTETAEVATFLSPATKTKNAKAYILRAKQLEKNGELKAALGLYEQGAAQNNKENKRPLQFGSSLLNNLKNALTKPRNDAPAALATPPSILSDGHSMEISPRATTEERLLNAFNSMDMRIIKKFKNIGTKRAQQIVEYIDEHGPLKSLQELSRAGISFNVLENIIKCIEHWQKE
ncbi:P-loop containing nucleoside triphosphate hydrolase protein [Syncephalis pseudoplumigaleata]|uniref:Kinesin-like protein n=1 Tax=Syncephalis pseudoplumigaleata TaxID=1712513 RepID=A0A4P9Z6E4_9FUNG|nr:P-loop containing nucleoside triphosphate hydrolase protein [Syncephalis pseudoplumigaleata]|eukprot:RKP28166.1 P-loop containing nucleoside triphosphate hydrolase protein [Syncephalis pseudoplumigaleata]